MAALARALGLLMGLIAACGSESAPPVSKNDAGGDACARGGAGPASSLQPCDWDVPCPTDEICYLSQVCYLYPPNVDAGPPCEMETGDRRCHRLCEASACGASESCCDVVMFSRTDGGTRYPLCLDAAQ